MGEGKNCHGRLMREGTCQIEAIKGLKFNRLRCVSKDPSIGSRLMGKDLDRGLVSRLKIKGPPNEPRRLEPKGTELRSEVASQRCTSVEVASVCPVFLCRGLVKGLQRRKRKDEAKKMKTRPAQAPQKQREQKPLRPKRQEEQRGSAAQGRTKEDRSQSGPNARRSSELSSTRTSQNNGTQAPRVVTFSSGNLLREGSHGERRKVPMKGLQLALLNGLQLVGLLTDGDLQLVGLLVTVTYSEWGCESQEQNFQLMADPTLPGT